MNITIQFWLGILFCIIGIIIGILFITNTISLSKSIPKSNERMESFQSNPNPPASFQSNPNPPAHLEHPRSAPTNIKAIRKDGQTLVSFSEVPDATFYSVIAYPDIIIAEGIHSPIIVPDLIIGRDYTFTVKAHNHHGHSACSHHSNQLHISNVELVPSIPDDLKVIAGDKKITVLFTADKNVSYKVSIVPGNKIATDIGSPIVIKDLDNGVNYNVSIVATNELGSSDVFVYPYSVTPLSESNIPLAPKNVKAHSKNHSALIHFEESKDATLYTITSDPGNQTVTGLHSPILFTDLMNGTSYSFTIVATNENGSSSPSIPSVPITPILAPIFTATKTNYGLGIIPEPPTYIIAYAGNGSALIQFKESVSAISYTVISQPGNIKATGLFSPIHIEPLENGVSYSFTVIATNKIGDSFPSEASNIIIPKI